MGGRPRALDQALVPSSPKRYVTLGVAKPRDNARLALKKLVGPNGELLWETIVGISMGHAWIPKLPDGREGPPQIPSTEDRLAAVKFVGEFLYGKAVPQTEIVNAEKAAKDQSALEDLPMGELLLEAKEAFREIAAGTDVPDTEDT